MNTSFREKEGGGNLSPVGEREVLRRKGREGFWVLPETLHPPPKPSLYVPLGFLWSAAKGDSIPLPSPGLSPFWGGRSEPVRCPRGWSGCVRRKGIEGRGARRTTPRTRRSEGFRLRFESTPSHPRAPREVRLFFRDRIRPSAPKRGFRLHRGRCYVATGETLSGPCIFFFFF